MKLKMPSYGGQAVIEGVLMRGKRFMAMAMRKPDGSIEIIQEELSAIYQSPIRKIPVLRGLIAAVGCPGARHAHDHRLGQCPIR